MPLLELFSPRQGDVQLQSGLNWGLSEGHTCPADAYIALRTSFFTNNPGFFPREQTLIDVTWDDGEQMICRLEGTQYIEGHSYPKQLSSDGDKSVIGTYLRRRLGVADDYLITMNDLNRYGRNTVEVTHISGNRYRFDFSVDR